MGDNMKDKFKGFMKKVNNQLSSSSSGKFKGQGRVLGSSSGPTDPIPGRPVGVSHFHNPNRNPNPNSQSTHVSSKPLTTHKLSASDAPLGPGDGDFSSGVEKGSLGSDPNHKISDGFDPYGSLVTSSNRNTNGYSLNNVFECPVCNCGFASEEEVSLHIDSCIADPSRNEGGGGDGDEVKLGVCVEGSESKDEFTKGSELDACVGSYLSGNPSEGSVEIVLRLLRNIVKEPENGKFRRVRMSNPKIREAIGEVVGGIELVECVGFSLKEEEGEMWAVMDVPSEEAVAIIKESIRLLEPKKNVQSVSATASVKKEADKVEPDMVKKTEPVIIDRQIKVFFSVPENIAARIELPDSFYNLSLDEVRREAEMRRKKMAESQLLIPKSYKEKQAQAARRRYNRAMIRIQFPDGVVLQGVFSPREPTSALYAFVSEALKQEGLEFELIHPVPVKRRVIPCFPKPGERASTLEEEDLVPSALVKFKPIETDSVVFTSLRNDLLELMEPLGSNKS